MTEKELLDKIRSQWFKDDEDLVDFLFNECHATFPKDTPALDTPNRCPCCRQRPVWTVSQRGSDQYMVDIICKKCGRNVYRLESAATAPRQAIALWNRITSQERKQ